MVSVVQTHDSKVTAIQLRKEGLSYNEILKQVPVAKSTLSLWLRSVGLSKQQKQRLTEKKLQAALRGALRRREQRLTLTEKIQNEALRDIGQISRRELWFIGIALYWAEGAKEKEDRPGLGVRFSNSDPHMIKLFLKWLNEIVEVENDRIVFDIFIHESCRDRISDVVKYWSKVTGFSAEEFNHIYFKKNKIKTNRKNIGISYFGQLRVNVKGSSILQRRIAGWVNGINKFYWGIV